MRRQYHPAYYQPAQRGMGAALIGELQPFHKRILSKANRYLKDGQKETAVVFAQAACEICTEYALTLLFQIKAVEFLAEPLLDIFQVRDIGNDRLRKVYMALSGDRIQQMPFWEKLMKHHKRRNKIVHKGDRCTKEEAEESISVVDQYIQHMDQVIKKTHLAHKSREPK